MLRKELEPTAPDPALVEKLSLVIRKIAEAQEIGEPTDALMQEHNQITGRDDIVALDYQSVWAGDGEKAAAINALLPKPAKVPDVSRDELIEIARRIVEVEEIDHADYYVGLFTMNTAANSDLIFWPDQDWLDRIGTNEPTPEQIVDEALRLTAAQNSKD